MYYFTSLAYTFNQRGSKHDPVSKYNIELWISTEAVALFLPLNFFAQKTSTGRLLHVEEDWPA